MAKTIIRGSVTLSSKKCTVTVSNTEPLNPTEYTLWIDTENNNVLKRWENGRWVIINDKKEVIDYIHEELSNKYYDKTTTNDLIKQIVGEVKITTDGKVSSDFKSLTTRIEESNSSFEQRSDEIASTVKSLKSAVGGEVYTSTPTVPYSEKDIWVDTDSSNNVTIKLCKNARTKDEKFYEADWEAIGDEKLDSYGMICTSAYSKVRQLSDKIEWIVSSDSSSSSMTLSDAMLKIVADKMDLQGNAVFRSLTNVDKNGVTTIDGSMITTGTLSADLINTKELFSQDITMTGTLISYYSDKTNQLVIGNGKLVMNSKSSGFCGIEIKREKLEEDCSGDFFTATNIRSDYIDITHMNTYERIAIGRVIERDGIKKSFGMYYRNANNASGFELWSTQEDEKCNMYLSGDSQIGGTLTVDNDVEIKGVIKGGTILDSTLTVEGVTTLKDKIIFESSHNSYKTEVSDFGMFFTFPNYYSSKMQYTAYGIRIYNRTGEIVGSLGFSGDYWSSTLQVEHIKSTYDIECGTDLTVNSVTKLKGTLTVSGATTLEGITVNGGATLKSTLTVIGATTHKSAIYLENNDNAFKNQITVMGVYFTSTGNSSVPSSCKTQYAVYGMEMRNRTGEIVGSFGHYNDYWSSMLQVEHIESKYDIKTQNVYNSAGLITSSDRKVKKDIKDIDDNFVNTLIDSMLPKTYKYTNGTSDRTHCGAIAQDIEDIIVEMGLTTQDFGGVVKDYKTKEVETESGNVAIETNYESEPDYYLRYEEFIMPLVRYCQLLKQRIEVLEKTLIKDEESKTEEAIEVEETVKTEEVIGTSEQNEN